MNTLQLKHVCISGLGVIGLPTACLLASSGYKVTGVDTNEEVLAQVQSATVTVSEKNLKELLVKVIQENTLNTSYDIIPAAIHIVTVPTLLTQQNQPDLSYVDKAIDAIIPHLRPEDLVIIESTCPIGTTQKISERIKATQASVRVAYCPERIIPGNILHELIHNDRIVGGIDEMSTLQAVKFYQSFVCGKVLSTNAKTAEAVKLAENVYRDINIAYANELSMIAESIDIDIHELISLANKHPRVQILQPGAGVGGHCIAMDPWFLISLNPKLALLTLQARQVNILKTEWVLQQIKQVIRENNVKTVACLGLTYKPNVSDLRFSPAFEIVRKLKEEESLEVFCVDPYVPGTCSLHDVFRSAEIIISLVAHNEFLNISPHHLNNKILLDFAGAFKCKQY